MEIEMKYLLIIAFLLFATAVHAQSVYIPTVGIPPLQGATGSQPVNPCPFGCPVQSGR